MERTKAYGRRVLIDTSAYFAVANRQDASHARCSMVLAQLVADRRRLFTTNFILAELHALLLTRIGRHTAIRALDEIDQSRTTTVVRVNARDEQRARQIVHQYQDKDFLLTDATSFAVMERLGIGQAFTLDHNFAQYGWVMIGATPS
jgi:predicted nucleic acid-binding protein